MASPASNTHISYLIPHPDDKCRVVQIWLAYAKVGWRARKRGGVSIKPMSYKSKNMLQKNNDSTIIFYDKVKDGIKVELDF